MPKPAIAESACRQEVAELSEVIANQVKDKIEFADIFP